MVSVFHTPTNRFVHFIIALISLHVGSRGQDYSSEHVQVLASFDFDDCAVDSDVCWSNGGPHVVNSSFGSSEIPM